MNIVRQIVDRCYVGDSDLKVIRYTISRLKNKYETFKSMSKEQKRALITECIRIHRENQAEYIMTATGNLRGE